ncbi:MAG: chorismate-binding protein [Bacteriovoracales bacterium]|nr:chorismate-binding protein [Bacteriovoracales bacterium]
MIDFCLPLSDGLLSFERCSRCLFYYKNRRFDLISGLTERSSLHDLNACLKKISPLDRPATPRVWHFFFEWGYHTNGLDDLIHEDDLLAIEMVFQKTVKAPLPSTGSLSIKTLSPPSFKDYKKSFERLRDHLLRGDCYQLNLTFPFHASFEALGPSPLSCALKFWGHHPAPYAHATTFSSLNKSFLSQSPECLFQVEEIDQRLVLQTMPIKGSLKFQEGDSFKQKWARLSQDKKEEGELFMIADLLRNDLARIELPRARVIKKKAPLKVSGILHQYSLLEVPLSRQVTLHTIMHALFPGGSVTGAPKKRVMEIIRGLEKTKRGLYCGTTFIQHQHIFCGNINIRTAEIDHATKRLTYFAGGGITLLSQVKDEYDEMLLKAQSFFQPLS